METPKAEMVGGEADTPKANTISYAGLMSRNRAGGDV
jgi:hypothetical protein